MIFVFQWITIKSWFFNLHIHIVYLLFSTYTQYSIPLQLFQSLRQYCIFNFPILWYSIVVTYSNLFRVYCSLINLNSPSMVLILSFIPLILYARYSVCCTICIQQNVWVHTYYPFNVILTLLRVGVEGYFKEKGLHDMSLGVYIAMLSNGAMTEHAQIPWQTIYTLFLEQPRHLKLARDNFSAFSVNHSPYN